VRKRKAGTDFGWYALGFSRFAKDVSFMVLNKI